MTECNPTYNTRRIPIAASIGGTKMVKAGIIGMILSVAYEGSVGGVVKESANNPQILSTPRSFPSDKYCIAKPNIRLLKSAPKSKTLVICQITKFGMLSL